MNESRSPIKERDGRIYGGEERKMLQFHAVAGQRMDEQQWNQTRDYLESAQGFELASQIFGRAIDNDLRRRGQWTQPPEDEG